jgi:hypothetical protein
MIRHRLYRALWFVEDMALFMVEECRLAAWKAKDAYHDLRRRVG